MKETVNAFDYSEQITKALPKGILLNTNGEKFNTMVIGWGHLGVIWGLPTFTVYVRQSRYTKPQLDAAGEFTISVPFGENPALTPEHMRLFGRLSGRDVNKAKELGLTLLPAEGMETAPRVDGAPVSLSCRVRRILPLGSHDLFLGEVTAVTVRKDLVDRFILLSLDIII